MKLKDVKNLLTETSTEPTFDLKDYVPFHKLRVGKIYATRGGAALIEENDESQIRGWGFEHVRIVEISDTITIETEWNPNLQVNTDYTFYETSEQVIKSLFPLLGLYLNKMELTFDQAKEIGLYVPEDAASGIETRRITASGVKKDEIDPVTKKGIVKYFAKSPRKVSDTADYFGMQYRQMRNIIFGIEDRGFEGKRYRLKRSEDSNGKLMFQFIER